MNNIINIKKTIINSYKTRISSINIFRSGTHGQFKKSGPAFRSNVAPAALQCCASGNITATIGAMLPTTRLFKTFALLLLSLFMVTAFSTDALAQRKKKDKKKKKKNKTEQVESPAENAADQPDDPELDRIFIEASKNRIIGDYKGAMQQYEAVLEKDPTNHAAMYELGRLYYEERSTEKALKLAESAVSLEPENKWYNLMLAEIYNANGSYKEAAKVYEQLTKNNPNNFDFWSEYSYMLLKSGDTKATLNILTKMESRFGLDETIAKQKKALYLKENSPEKAAEVIENLMFIYPENTGYHALLADVYEQTDQPEKAIEGYNRWLEDSPENPYALLALADIYLQQGDEEKYNQYINEAFNNNSLDVDSKIKILIPFVDYIGKDDKKTKQAFNMLDLLVKSHPESAKVYGIKGDFHNRNDDKEAALEAYKKSVEIDQNAFNVWEQILFVEANLERFDEVIKTANGAMEVFPNQLTPYYFKGIALSRNKDHDEAIKTLKQGTLIGSNNPDLVAQMHSLLADAYNAKKDYKKSDESFEEALKINPENATALNNYSYYLSLRADQLEKAEEMAVKANKIEPDNASFQDTYGWILYKLRKYDEAKKWLLKSYNNGGEENSTILDHLGDVEYRLDNKAKALDYWKKALEAGNVDDEDNLKKKIADKKLYEQ